MRYLMLLASASLGLTGISWPQKAEAWGELGHLTVCDLAYRNLTPTSKAAVTALLRSKTGGISIPASPGNEARRYTSFNIGCLEEDSRPKKHPKDHFINYDRSLAAITNDTCPLSPSSHQPLECIFKGLARDRQILQDTHAGDKARVVALMAIGHWIGDLHQPLHISYEDDVGGNNIKASFSGYCGKSATGRAYHPDNLHAVWDNCLLQQGLFEKARNGPNYKPTWGQRSITYEGVRLLQSRTTLAEETSIVQGSPWQWAQESFAITRQPSVRYCTLVGLTCQFLPSQITWLSDGIERKEVIDSTYIAEWKGVAEERVRLAGFRLADILNQALDPAYHGPIKNSQQPS